MCSRLRQLTHRRWSLARLLKPSAGLIGTWERSIEELATLKAASTWRLEEAPPGANIIGSKWVFKAKKDAAGNIAH
jgi:hypothetical protein